MKRKKWLILIVSITSILAGIAYLYGLMMGFQFLGSEAGSEQEAVQYWGKISFGLGLTLLVTILTRTKMKEKVNDGLLIFILILLFITQLPPIALWLLVVIFGFWGGITGLILHSLLLLFIVRIVTLGHRQEKGIKLVSPEPVS